MTTRCPTAAVAIILASFFDSFAASQRVLPFPFALGSDHSCVGNLLGELKCFGLNDSGQLGIGSTESMGDESGEMGAFLPLVDIGNGMLIDQIDCGYAHNCAILKNNQGMKCWGLNDQGQLGLGDVDNRGDEINEMGDDLPLLNLGSDGSIPFQLALGSNHTCIRFDQGMVKCFGDNAFGQLGIGSTTDKGLLPSDMGDNLLYIDLGENVTAFSIASSPVANHNCVILVSPASIAQRMKCWGSNQFNQLGYGDFNDRGDQEYEMGNNLTTLPLGIERRVVAIGLGYGHTCAINLLNALICWGRNLDGQLGIGTNVDVTIMGRALFATPVDSGLGFAINIIAGNFHSCFVLDDKLSVKCVGNNDNGQLGQGDTIQRGNLPTNTADNFPAIDLGTGSLEIKYIDAGNDFTCIAFADTAVKCFGFGGHGAIGSGSSRNIGTSTGDMGSNLPFVDLFSTFSPTTSPTRSPSSTPTMNLKPVPTKNPTSTPTKNPSSTPTKRPTSAPSKRPSKKPTNKPTKFPTSRPVNPPSQSPTKLGEGFFGPGGVEVGGIEAYDLYILIDRSGPVADSNDICSSFTFESGESSNSCIKLFLDFSWALIERIANEIGYYRNRIERGLRVSIFGFSCDSSQEEPITIDILSELTGDKISIKDSIDSAKITMRSSGGSCPHVAIGKIIKLIEDNWDTVEDRPFRQVVTLTSGIIYGGNGNYGFATVNSMIAMDDRCAKGITITPDIGSNSLPAEEFLVQKKYLNVLTSNQKKSQFEFGDHESKIIPKIGIQMGNLAVHTAKNPVCFNSDSFQHPETFWCGYAERNQCVTRELCIWSTGHGCSKDTSKINCKASNDVECLSLPGCEWTGSSCIVKRPPLDCADYKMKVACKNQIKCIWKNGSCVAK